MRAPTPSAPDVRTPMVVAFVLLLLVFVAIAAFIARLRPAYPEPGSFLRGMFRYEPDLGWPRGVQEEDGERAWVPASERRADGSTSGGSDAVGGSSSAEAGDVEPVNTARVRRA